MSGAEAERRQWPRIPAALLSNVTASIMAGPDVKLVNLSRGGALMEVAARYPMRSKVRLKLTRSTGEVTQVPGTVSWAKVASIANGKINYLLAVIFERSIEDLTAATGVEDIENAALAAATPDPGYGDEAIHAVQSSAPEEPDVLLASTLADAEPTPLFVEEDLSDAVFAVREVLTSVPAPLATPVEDAADARALVDRAELAAAEARMEELRRELERAASEAAALSAANDSLSAQLQTHDQERVTLRSDLEAARRRWEDEKSGLTADAVATLARVNELEAALEQHRQSGGQALADQQRREQDQDRELAEARMLQQVLQSRLDALDGERREWTVTLETERACWQDERSALERAAAAAAATITELQGVLQRREQEQAQSLDEARSHHRSLQDRLESLEGERADWTRQQQQWHHEREQAEHERTTLAQHAVDARARVDLLEATLQSRQDDHARTLAEQQATALSLAAQVESLDADRLETRRELEAERQRRHDDRVRASAELAARAEEFRAAQEERQRIHADAIAEQQGHFERLIAELMQAANDQQAEYQQLMAERTAAFEEQVARVERAHVELARVRAEANQQRAALDQRCRELAAQLEAAEAVAMAQESRYRAVRHEAGRLVALLSSPVQAGLPVEDIDDFRAERHAAQAVAGG